MLPAPQLPQSDLQPASFLREEAMTGSQGCRGSRHRAFPFRGRWPSEARSDEVVSHPADANYGVPAVGYGPWTNAVFEAWINGFKNVMLQELAIETEHLTWDAGIYGVPCQEYSRRQQMGPGTARSQQSVQSTITPSSSHRSCQSLAPGHRNTWPLTRRLLRSSVAMVAISASVSFSVTAAARFAS